MLYVAPFLIAFSSCVTPKVYNTLAAEKKAIELALNNQEREALKLRSNTEELLGEISFLKVQLQALRRDSMQNSESLSMLGNKYDMLNESYDLLASKRSREMKNKAKEIKELLEKQQNIQSDLFIKEDRLSRLVDSLQLKEEALIMSQKKLSERSSRVAELESIINKKDSLVTALKSSISKALTGLEGEGLTIEQRNGKVYLSVEEDLLFASGKYEVNNKGVTALNKLSIVLASQDDLEILVEGHTDSIPFNGKGVVRDNWDLSVMRATNVVKVLTKNTDLNPLQLTAAGRAEFLPISTNETTEGRSKNRRIEMILSPNLDDLFKLLE